MPTKRHSRREKPEIVAAVDHDVGNKRRRTQSQAGTPIISTQGSQYKTPTQTAAAEKETQTLVVMEMGASHCQLMYREPGKEWTSVTWPEEGEGVNRGRLHVMPTVAAYSRGPDNKEIRPFYGQEAIDQHHYHRQVDTFHHLKLAFVKVAPTPAVQTTLDEQDKRAKAYGTNIIQVAIAFFEHALHNLSGVYRETAVLYFNISDSWSNKASQRLLRRFQTILPNVEIHAIDECLSSALGVCHGQSLNGMTRHCAFIAADCGHSTMNLSRLWPSTKKHHHRIRDNETFSLGAGNINAAAEAEVREINRLQGLDLESGILGMSLVIDKCMKPNMNYTPLPPRGFDEHEWHRVTTAAKKANDELDKRRVDRIQHMLDKNRAQSSDQQVQVILTGNASKSKTFLERLSAVVAKKYPEAKICHPSPGERTAVLAGLQYIAENPEFLHVTCAPLSFWLRSDADAGDGLAKRAIRVCRKNQQLNVQPASDYRVNDRDAFRPVHLELNKYGDGPFELDLSVFGTPSKVKDEDISTQYSHITRGRLEEGFVYARIEDLVRYGDFRTDVLLKDLPVDGICHVYVFSKLTAVEITLFAAFAANGREMKELESLGLIDVEGLKTHAAADVEVIRLGQVARLGTYQKEIRLHES